LHAAAEVFGECGYSGAGINRILQRAGVTAGAMYFHFSSKEDLARAVICDSAADLNLPEGGPGLQHLIDVTLYLARELQHNSFFQAGVQLAIEQGESGLREYGSYEWWAERYLEDLRAARSQGELLPEVQEEELAQIVVGGFTGLQVMSKISTDRADLPQRIAAFWRCLVPAVAVPETRAALVIPRDGAPR
jgi:AcrR family transcriptional regulator